MTSPAVGGCIKILIYIFSKIVMDIYLVSSCCSLHLLMSQRLRFLRCFRGHITYKGSYKTSLLLAPIFTIFTCYAVWCAESTDAKGGGGINSSRREVVHLNPLTSAILAYYSPYYSPYNVISDVIGNPHYSASYPYVIVDLRGARVGARVTAKARVTRQLAQTQCVSVRDPSIPWRHHAYIIIID